MVEIISILLVVYVVYVFTKRSRKGAKKKATEKLSIESNEELKVKPISSGLVPHKKHDYLGSKSERQFYKTLLEILPSEYIIHCQVSMMALVQPVNFKDNSKTWAKRIDYVITDRDTQILAVIELDDSSHRQKKRQERDLYVNSAFEGNHKLLRFEAAGDYDPIEIALVIERETDIRCNVSEPAPMYG